MSNGDNIPSGAVALREIVGDDAMERIIRELGGATIYIPHTLPKQEKQIAQTFWEYNKTTKNTMEAYRHTAYRHGISIRHVQRIVSNMTFS